MSTSTLHRTPPTGHARSRQAEPQGDRPPGEPENAGSAGRGLLGLLALAITLVAAVGTLGARTWQVGKGLGPAFFPIEGIVELAAVTVGTVVASWAGLHTCVALACVLADRRGVRWAAGERTVARHAPAMVRRLARAAAGAGLGLALTAPAAMALPGALGVPAAPDAGPAVVLDLDWQPTGSETADRRSTLDGAPHRSDASHPGPALERSSMVNRSRRTGMEREPLVVVEPGDTLWAIAADRLAGGAHDSVDDVPTDTAVANAVVRWHHANRELLGSNPDLIRPGMVLHQP